MKKVNAARESRNNSEPLKVELALDLLVRADRAGVFVTTLDASAEYGDTCFHTTIASLRDRGFRFDQMPYKHQHRHGGTAHLQSYRLSEKSRATALNLLQHYASLRMGDL